MSRAIPDIPSKPSYEREGEDEFDEDVPNDDDLRDDDASASPMEMAESREMLKMEWTGTRVYAAEAVWSACVCCSACTHSLISREIRRRDVASGPYKYDDDGLVGPDEHAPSDSESTCANARLREAVLTAMSGYANKYGIPPVSSVASRDTDAPRRENVAARLRDETRCAEKTPICAR